ncbi:hypothetical protein ACQP1W_44340 [Spirillospora sp. CA-255316]
MATEEEIRGRVERLRAVLPEEVAHRWRLPPGRVIDGPAALPSGVRRLYALTWAPRVGWLVLYEPDQIAVADDDFREWGMPDEANGRWACFGKCAEARLYVDTVDGTVATVSTWDLKEGRLRLRPLAADVLEFFAEYAIGPRYPVILEDPVAQPILPAADDEWMRFLLEHGFVDRAALADLEARWAARYVPPQRWRPPEAWTQAPPGELERSLRSRLDRLQEVGYEVFASSGAADEWDLNHLGFFVDGGVGLSETPDPSEWLWRLHRLAGAASFGPLGFHAEGFMLDQTKSLPRRFAKLGLDPDDARQWYAVGAYHGKAVLLLHRETGQVAGLEPSPADRLRPLHADIYGFIDEYGLGERHRELIYRPRSRTQVRAARQWLDFLRACGVLTPGPQGGMKSG